MARHPKILFLPLEFPVWEWARSLSYAGQLGIEEGLKANGIAYETIPVFHGIPPSVRPAWLDHARELCKGKQYDQVWVELVHSNLDEDSLSWIATLAPVRVGFILESMQYEPEVYTVAPHLKPRQAQVEGQLRYMTHAVVVDERDAADINARGLATAIWWPQAVPERFIDGLPGPAADRRAIFLGAVYGERLAWLEHPDLKDLLVRPRQSPEEGTEYPKLFDDLSRAMIVALAERVAVDRHVLDQYLDALRSIRRECFALWLQRLKEGCAVVNLPSFLSGYPGRIYEAMAVGRPVISWEIPNRPRTKALFKDGEEILLFPKDATGRLAEQIRRIQRDPDFARQIAENAQRKLRQFHTVERRVREILDWVETGVEPTYGESAEAVHSGHVQTIGALTSADNFCIKPGYTARLRPQYFQDAVPPGLVLQPHVYPLAALLARQFQCTHIIDIGCGRAQKLAALHPEFQIIGIDCGDNLHFCRENYPFGTWLEADLERCDTLSFTDDLLEKSVVICSDVIEHLVNPASLLHTLRTVMERAQVALLSTPERDLTRGDADSGPPANLCHAREWNLGEFVRILRSAGLRPGFAGLTLSHNRDPAPKTILAALANTHWPEETVDQLNVTCQLGLARLSWAGPGSLGAQPQAMGDAAERNDLAAYFQQAERDLLRDDLNGASGSLRKALALAPDDPRLIIAHGSILLRLGEMEAARREFTRATALAPTHAPAYANLASTLLTLGRIKEAEAAARRALSLDPNDAETQHLLSKCLARRVTTTPGRETASADAAASGTANGHPLVSVIVPTYNRPVMLKRALESIAAQTFQNCEVIVVNDAGSEAGDVVESFNRDGGRRFKSLRHDRNRGLAASRNTGIGKASGKYIAYLDDDDVYYPDHLETLVNALENGQCRAAYTDSCRAQEEPRDGQYRVVRREPGLSNDFSRDMFLATNLTPVLNVMHEKRCLDTVGLFDETLDVLEDWELWIRLSRKYEFLHIPKVTAEVRGRPDGTQMTSERQKRFPPAREYIYNKHAAHYAALNERIQKESPHQKESPQSRPRVAIIGREVNAAPSVPASKSGRASIIILAWNQLEYTRQCVESVLQWTHRPYELILVDNGSTDGTLEYFRSVPGAKVIANGANLGFAAGNNRGIQAANGDYIVLLNNDTIVTEGWLDGLIACAEEDSTIGIIGPISNYVSGPQQAPEVPYRDLPTLWEYARSFREQHRGRRMPLDRIVGFCMLITREALTRIGLLDERFGLGNFEDDDYCLRAKQAGFRLVVAGDVFIHHYGGRTFLGQGIDFAASMKRGQEVFMDKWNGKSGGNGHGASPAEFLEAGRRRFVEGKNEEAMEAFTVALHGDPSNGAIWNDLACAHAAEGNPREAERCFRKAEILSEGETRATASRNLGALYVQQSRWPDAIASYEAAIEKAFDVDTLVALSDCYLRMGAAESSILGFRKALELAPDHFQARAGLAAAERLAGRR